MSASMRNDFLIVNFDRLYSVFQDKSAIFGRSFLGLDYIEWLTTSTTNVEQIRR